MVKVTYTIKNLPNDVIQLILVFIQCILRFYIINSVETTHEELKNNLIESLMASVFGKCNNVVYNRL